MRRHWKWLGVGLALMLALRVVLAPLSAGEGPGFRSGVAALALWSDPVFKSEARGAARVVASAYGHSGPVAVVANSAGRLAAGPRGIASALAAASRGLDSSRDVLFVILTSHGAPEGIADRGGGQTGLVSPAALGSLLEQSPVRHKVLIVSACFAGIFTGLADPDTLVITAADATHTSFGCQPQAHWTYFGDAFFNQALRARLPIVEAFAEARKLIAAREAGEGFEPSNPQIAGGEEVLSILDRAH